MNASVTSIALPATVMQNQAQAVANDLVARLIARVGQGSEAVLDASALAQFDSSALAVLLACRRAVMARGTSLRITGPPDRAQALARVYGVNELLA